MMKLSERRKKTASVSISRKTRDSQIVNIAERRRKKPTATRMNNAYEMKSYGWSFSRRNISSFLARSLSQTESAFKAVSVSACKYVSYEFIFFRLVCVCVEFGAAQISLFETVIRVLWELLILPIAKLVIECYNSISFFSLLWVDLLDEIHELPLQSARLSKLDADKYRTKAEISIPTKNENASHSKRQQQQQQHQIQNDLLPERSGNRNCTHSIADEGILLLPLKQRASGKTPNYYNTNNCFQSFIMRFNTS